MGSTKRMSNGEAKLDAPASQTTSLFNGTFDGPHPSTIRVSAPYVTQAVVEQRLQLSTSTSGSAVGLSIDAHERSLTEAREDSARLQGVTWLDSVRRALQLPVKTFTTACVYYHKFRLAHPNVEYNWVDAAAASLLTSCKNEDTLKKSRDILAAAYNLKQSAAHEYVSADDPMFEIPSRVAIGLERLVLESGAFDFRSRSPHHVLVKVSRHLSKTLQESQKQELLQVTQLAWIILTDIHRTFAPLKQTSATLALAALELAISLRHAAAIESAATLLDSMRSSHTHWHTSRQEVMETLLDTLDLYTHHTAATILGNKFTLDDFLRVRLALNKECAASELARFSVAQPAPSDQSGNTLRVSNGHPTPVSPPQLGQAAQTANNVVPVHPTPEGGGTLRFMLNPQRSVDEKVEVNRYYIEEWEEYEEEVEVPVKSTKPRERSRDYYESSHHRKPEAWSRSTRDDRDRDRDRLRDRERDTTDRDSFRARDRERDRRYDDRRYDERDRDRDRDRHYDVRRDRDRHYYEEDSRRRPREDRR